MLLRVFFCGLRERLRRAGTAVPANIAMVAGVSFDQSGYLSPGLQQAAVGQLFLLRVTFTGLLWWCRPSKAWAIAQPRAA